eukprot:TRINITY_DN12432_c0_g2_i1.p1 TRINITY_DN12432_c0_g2~~TRINITY_DN12432_c0_g2_i1.p1  ORF type:complete len:430 (+),score=74.70 TRINITY_DN12432_c0_g2_i1:26-1291(+)
MGKFVGGGLRVLFEKFVKDHRVCVKKDFHLLTNLNLSHFQHGPQILSHFKNTSNFLLQVYPFFQWTTLDAPRFSPHYWTKPPRSKFFLEFISQKLPRTISRQSDWKFLEEKEIRKYHGRSLFHLYSSVMLLLQENFPQFFWEKTWRYPRTASRDHRRVFLDGLLLSCFGFVETGEQLGHIEKRDFSAAYCGGHILNLHHGSLQELLGGTYPECPGSCRNAKRGYWKHGRFGSSHGLLHRVMRRYDIRKREDWYRLSALQFSEVYGKGVPQRYIIKMLNYWNPEEDWEGEREILSEKLNKKARQRYLGLSLRALFGDEVIVEDYVFKDDSVCLVFDFYVPRLGLVLEYQGEQHYYSVLRWASHKEQIKRDKLKATICYKNQLTLVYIPFWWDNHLHSLKHLIHSQTHSFKLQSNATPLTTPT